jgi:hypothetical protein
MIDDMRYALRGFRRSPVFAPTAVFAIVPGIGATTAVFSVVDRISLLTQGLWKRSSGFSTPG